MLTKRQNMLETIRGGKPDRFVNQFEALEFMYGNPVSGMMRPPPPPPPGPPFTFGNIAELGDEAVQRALRELTQTDLELALKLAGEEVKSKILKQLSKRAAKLLQDEMDAMGAIRVRDAEAAQQRIIGVFLALAQAGEIAIPYGELTQPDPFRFVKNTPPEQILSLLENQHPQTVALVLSHMKPESAAGILTSFEPEIQADIVARIARMDAGLTVGGLPAVAGIINAMDRDTEKTLLERLEHDPELAEAIRESLFVFEDIAKLDDLAMQRVIRDIPQADLVMALRFADDSVKTKFLKNMSKRAAQFLKDDLDAEAAIPVSESDSQAARKRIIDIVRKLEEAGEIVVAGAKPPAGVERRGREAQLPPGFGGMREGRMVNQWGVTIQFSPDLPGPFPVHDEEHIVLKDVTKWREQVKFPNLKYPREDWLSAAEAAKNIDRNEKFATVTMAPGIFDHLHYLMGMENALISFYEEPEALKELINALTEWELEYISYICEYLKPDAVFHHDDWGSHRSTFLSPEMFAEFILPSYKKIYGYFKEHGVELVIHHSDSYAATLVPYMIEAGVDVFQGCVDTNDVPALIKRYGGKISFMGNINNGVVDVPDWTDALVAETVEKACRECGTLYFIPCCTAGGPGSAYPGVYDAVTREIDRMSAEMF